MKKILVAMIAACAMSLAVPATNAGPAGGSILGAGLTNVQSSNSGVVLIKKRRRAGHHRPHHRPHHHRRRARAVAAGVAAGVAIGAAATAEPQDLLRPARLSLQSRKSAGLRRARLKLPVLTSGVRRATNPGAPRCQLQHPFWAAAVVSKSIQPTRRQSS